MRRGALLGDTDAPAGLFCRDETACETAAKALRDLIGLGEALGASPQGEILPKPSGHSLDDTLRDLQRSTYGDKSESGKTPAKPPAAPPPQQPQPSQSPQQATAFCERILGEWDWRTGSLPGVLKFTGDRWVEAAPRRGAPPALVGMWQCDEARKVFTIQWPNGVVETVALPDRSHASGSNNYGAPIRGTRLE